MPAPVNLRITDVTKHSFRGTWDHGAPDVSLYRITWGPYGRSEKQEVRIVTIRFWGQSLRGHILKFIYLFIYLSIYYFPHKTILNGDDNSLVFENLDPDTLYEVSVTAIYPDESESDDLIGSERTCK